MKERVCASCEQPIKSLFFKLDLVTKSKRDTYPYSTLKILNSYIACSLTCIKKILDEEAQEMLVSLL